MSTTCSIIITGQSVFRGIRNKRLITQYAKVRSSPTRKGPKRSTTFLAGSSLRHISGIDRIPTRLNLCDEIAFLNLHLSPIQKIYKSAGGAFSTVAAATNIMKRTHTKNVLRTLWPILFSVASHVSYDNLEPVHIQRNRPHHSYSRRFHNLWHLLIGAPHHALLHRSP